MKLKNFYQYFDSTPNEERFRVFNPTPEPTSLFVIFQQLTIVRAQKKYFEHKEAHLLKVVEEEFKKRDDT